MMRCENVYPKCYFEIEIVSVSRIDLCQICVGCHFKYNISMEV